jgi:hypothetical protein
MDINFLRLQREAIEEKKQKERKLARGAVITMIVFSVLSLGVFAGELYMRSRLKQSEKAIMAIKTSLQELTPVQKEYIVYAQKVSLLHDIDKERQKKRKALNYFYSLIPDEYILLDAKADEDAHAVVFSIQANDVFASSSLIALVYGDTVASEGYTVVGTGLKRDEKGVYVLDGMMKY